MKMTDIERELKELLKENKMEEAKNIVEENNIDLADLRKRISYYVDARVKIEKEYVEKNKEWQSPEGFFHRNSPYYSRQHVTIHGKVYPMEFFSWLRSIIQSMTDTSDNVVTFYEDSIKIWKLIFKKGNGYFFPLSQILREDEWDVIHMMYGTSPNNFHLDLNAAWETYLNQRNDYYLELEEFREKLNELYKFISKKDEQTQE